MIFFIGYVWTEAVSATKKLRFQTKTDTCGRGLISHASLHCMIMNDCKAWFRRRIYMRRIKYRFELKNAAFNLDVVFHMHRIELVSGGNTVMSKIKLIFFCPDRKFVMNDRWVWLMEKTVNT